MATFDDSASRLFQVIVRIEDLFKSEMLRVTALDDDHQSVRWNGPQQCFQLRTSAVVDQPWYDWKNMMATHPWRCRFIIDAAFDLYELAVTNRNEAILGMQSASEKGLLLLESLHEKETVNENA